MMDRDKMISFLYNIILYLYILQNITGHIKYPRLSLYNYLYKNPYNCYVFKLFCITCNSPEPIPVIPYLDYLTRIERYPKVEDMAS